MSSTDDDPNQLGNFSIKEISIIIAVISIAITMIAASALIIIVGVNLDWSEDKNQIVGLELMSQVGIMFTAIGNGSLLLIGMGAGTGAVILGSKLRQKKTSDG